MKLLTLELINFGGYKNLKFIFPKEQDVFAFVGKNGVGKSTIFNAVAFAFGWSDVPKKHITTKGEKNFQDLLEFALDGSIYAIDKTSTYLHLYKDGVQISATNTQKEIDNLIKCSSSTFFNCVYYKQNSASFLSIPSNLKLRFFEELFQNSELEKAKELSELEYKKYENEYAVLARQKDKLLSEIDNRKANVSAWQSKNKAAQESVFNLVFKDNYKKERLYELETLYSSQSGMTEERHKLLYSYKLSKNKINDLTRLIISLKKSKCDACNQSIELDEERILSLEKQKKEENTRLEDIKSKGESLKTSNWNDLLGAELKELQAKKQNFLIAQDRVKEYSEMVVNEVQLLGLAKTGLRKLESKIKEVSELLEASRKTKEMLSNKGLKRVWIESIVNVLNERISEIAAIFDVSITVNIDIEKVTNPFEITYNGLPFPLPSGGQTRICELVLFLAFNSIANTKFDFIILDEVFENLDNENRAKMWEIINSIDYLSIYIISHLDIETENKFLVETNKITKI